MRFVRNENEMLGAAKKAMTEHGSIIAFFII